MLLKALFKLIVKWILQMVSAAEGRGEASANGTHRQNGAGGGMESHAERVVERTFSGIKQAVGQFEANVSRVAEQLCDEGVKTGGEEQASADVNELRAELAELKADIRALKRLITQSYEPHGPTEG